jgi:succinate-semialdehyde dehydrogenase/glutarate-semialdehyde dehydrogenase
MTDYAVVNPATGETVKEYPTITDEQLKEAIAKADRTHQEWAASSTVEERAALVRRVGELHTEQRQRLAEIIVREMGKPIEQALGEVDFSAAIYDYYADKATALMADEQIELLEGEGSAFIRRSSLGVLLGIMPWNYPYYQVARFAAPNLVIGNTILLKHAPQCPESAEAMEQLFRDAGFPDGAYINIFATNEQIEWVIADPRVRAVSLTGSERAGAAVAEIAGRNLKKVVLELGGSDPFILLSTDDLDSAVESAVGARLENSGQACNAAKRFIVVDELYEPFMEKFTAALTAVKPADPNSPDTTVGPLSSKLAGDRLEDQVKRAVDQGAKLVAGGDRDGNFFETTILTDITPENDAYREEFFGPVASVYRVGSEDEAIRLANDTPFGLGSYVFTNDREQALRVADQIEAGMVFVNAVGAEGAELPFGGVKRSGFGRELGRFGADEFVNKKLIRVVS